MTATIAVLDDESSVAFNVAHAVAALGWTPVVRTLSSPAAGLDLSGVTHIVLVTGRAPAEAQAVIDTLVKKLPSHVVLIGIGNGALSLAAALGVRVPDERPLAPGVVEVCHDGRLSFGNLKYRFRAWTPRLPRLSSADLSEGLEVTATTPAGAVLAFRHRTHPREGVLFHPESSGTPEGLRWFANVFGVKA
ncbi:MAG: hypothetical protein RML57_13270 [Acidobacteriota bacterium]|nr:hypothetical protein [Acidobacteriota bacterium]